MANKNLSLRSLLEKKKLNGINFLDWFQNLRIVLNQERNEYVIEEPVPDEPTANAPRDDKDKFKKHMDDMISRGSSRHQVDGLYPNVEKLGFPPKDELATNVILQSFPDRFKPFVLNFNMNEMKKTFPQLLDMLRTAEK
ncbi:hypothetical protein GQ457_05G020630 [Hibiscus cannabinus]